MFTQLRFTIVEISYFKHLGNTASLEFQYLRISCLLNPYSKQIGDSTELLLIAANNCCH